MPRPDDICPQPDLLPPLATRPHAAPLYPTSVWQCDDPDQADALLGGHADGYVYQRDRHPNADLFAAKCKELHGAERAAAAASGMAALAGALLSQLETGDAVAVSRLLYGRSLLLFGPECKRLGVDSSTFDPCDLDSFQAALGPRTRLAVVETIANPRLQVADIGALARIAHDRGVVLLVDNTFATPCLCRPLDLGADLVMESVSKMMNGHSDVMLGLLCGRADRWSRVPTALSAWGLASSPFDCWLACRGLATLPLRIDRAGANALAAARFLAEQPQVESVDYPGLPTHPQHELARRQFQDRYGTIVTFHLPGGRDAAVRFMRAASRIPFCPSLGETSTTLSHPESTSHRGLTAEDRAALGITGGTIRLSVGVESPEYVLDALREGLSGV